MHIRRTVAHP